MLHHEVTAHFSSHLIATMPLVRLSGMLQDILLTSSERRIHHAYEDSKAVLRKWQGYSIDSFVGLFLTRFTDPAPQTVANVGSHNLNQPSSRWQTFSHNPLDPVLPCIHTLYAKERVR